MPKLTKISQRQYAIRIGVSSEAVRMAIEKGRISKGFDPATKQVIVEIADKEWGALHMKNKIGPILQQEPGGKIKGTSSDKMTLSPESSFAEAKRVREIIQAQLAALDLKERKGELVKKEEVYKQLYAFGQQIRIAFTALPERVLDSLLATKDRTAASQLLNGELHEILEGLTKADFNFTPRQ